MTDNPDASTPQAKGSPARVVILGGGIAGIEAALALHDLAGDRVRLSVVAPEPEFTYKPLVVEEPFTHEPAERHHLAPAMTELGAEFVPGSALAVLPDEHVVELDGGARVEYDVLVVCVGGRPRPAYDGVKTFWSTTGDLAISELLEQARSAGGPVVFVVPPGTSWPLPLYELALMTRRHSEETGAGEVEIAIVTPEESPLAVFGSTVSDALAELLRARRIDVHGGVRVTSIEDSRLESVPGLDGMTAGAIVALPVIDGPALEGLPSDDRGFIPIDDHARVRGVADVYAAGDGTDFPMKQGGIGTQQADAAAEHVAARLGVPIDPAPFHPVLRGQLITGAESLNLQHDLTGGHGEGAASLDYLWWPPHKVSGRYLAAWLAHETPRLEPDAPERPMDVEVSLAHEWHGTPSQASPETG